ncbi:MAG: hypothetical protein D3911_01430 [Candidatus Electrothrix sp. AW3_4]|nr:hypothetical protein [Candidatus Electrothrix gigas]
MVRVVARLAGIFLAVYLAVSLGYARLEKELLNKSCCITGLSSPVGSSTASTASNTNTSSSAVPVPEATQRLSEPGPKLGSKPGTEPVPQSLHTKKPNFQIIVHRNIFQLVEKEKPKVPKEKLPPPPVQKDVPKAAPAPTQLNVTLLGTVQGDGQTSRAIIMGGKKNEQKLYRVGDAVKVEGAIAIIESIKRGQVVLDVSGRKEILTMKKRKGGGPGPPEFNRHSMQRSVRNTPSNRRNRISPPEPEIPDELEGLEDTEEDIEDLIEDLEQDEENEEDELTTEKATAKKYLNRRRPPAIRPHRRINFRRNPIRSIPKVDLEEEE